MPWRPKTHGERQRPKRQHVDRRPVHVKRMYGWQWQKARAAYLAANPLCVHCHQEGRDELANTVDHIIPHKGDETLFWDESNWSATCETCHNRLTVKYDGGFGNPVKPKPSKGT